MPRRLGDILAGNMRDTTLVFCILLFMMKAVAFYYVVDKHAETLRADEEVMLRLPLLNVPEIAMFIEDTRHFQMDDDEEWASLSPGNGVVHLGPYRQPFTVAMFHQLRCLDIVREGLVDLQKSGRGRRAAPTSLGRHCINYLRQTIMCRNDVDLDLAIGEPIPNAYPEAYLCRDWKVVYAEVERNQRPG